MKAAGRQAQGRGSAASSRQRRSASVSALPPPPEAGPARRPVDGQRHDMVVPGPSPSWMSRKAPTQGSAASAGKTPSRKLGQIAQRFHVLAELVPTVVGDGEDRGAIGGAAVPGGGQHGRGHLHHRGRPAFARAGRPAEQRLLGQKLPAQGLREADHPLLAQPRRVLSRRARLRVARSAGTAGRAPDARRCRARGPGRGTAASPGPAAGPRGGGAAAAERHPVPSSAGAAPRGPCADRPDPRFPERPPARRPAPARPRARWTGTDLRRFRRGRFRRSVRSSGSSFAVHRRAVAQVCAIRATGG